jgi:DNA polymerase/3'-5' exonuclease PolX
MSLTYEVTSGKALAAAKTKVEGVGASTAAKIDEILATGMFAKLEDMRAKATRV